mgnify:CR=1 FL=1
MSTCRNDSPRLGIDCAIGQNVAHEKSNAGRKDSEQITTQASSQKRRETEEADSREEVDDHRLKVKAANLSLRITRNR